jgi:hypothetical protein
MQQTSSSALVEIRLLLMDFCREIYWNDCGVRPLQIDLRLALDATFIERALIIPRVVMKVWD